MPTFSTTLPTVSKHHGYDLRRTPPSKPITAICTCDNILCCDTHFWHGRTLPCERIINDDGKTIDDTPCPACQAKQPFRTHVYISAFDAKSHEHFLFECTAFAAKPLADYIQSVGTLRGCVFNASRPKCGPNSKVVIATTTANLSRINLPNPPDIPTALSIIWRLPRTGITTNTPKHSPPRVRTNAKTLARMRNQPDNSSDPLPMSKILDGNGR